MKPGLLRSAPWLLLFLALGVVSGCVLSRTPAMKSGTMTGILIMTGSEPFARLSLRAMNGQTFVLEDDSTSVYSELRRLQGKKVAVRYRMSGMSLDSSIIIIEQYDLITDH